MKKDEYKYTTILDNSIPLSEQEVIDLTEKNFSFTFRTKDFPLDRDDLKDVLRIGFEYKWPRPTALLNAISHLFILSRSVENLKKFSVELEFYSLTIIEIGKTIRKLESIIKEKDDRIKHLLDELADIKKDTGDQTYKEE